MGELRTTIMWETNASSRPMLDSCYTSGVCSLRVLTPFFLAVKTSETSLMC